MKKILLNPTTVILILIISLCAYNTWNISAQSIDNRKMKSDMSKFMPRHSAESGIGGLHSDAPAIPIPDSHGIESSGPGVIAPEIIEIEATEMKLPVNPFIINMQMETNPDIVGWINIPGTNIDYPIVRAEDNDYYLRRSINGESAAAGSIFMDYRCNPELAHYNTIIYGHNMKDHSMFGDLRLFADPGFFEENQHGTLFTVLGTYTIRFFAFMVVPSDDGQIYTNPSSPEDFHGYIKEKARNYREPGNPDRVITLSTCSKEFENARGVLIAYVCD